MNCRILVVFSRHQIMINRETVKENKKSDYKNKYYIKQGK